MHLPSAHRRTAVGGDTRLGTTHLDQGGDGVQLDGVRARPHRSRGAQGLDRRDRLVVARVAAEYIVEHVFERTPDPRHVDPSTRRSCGGHPSGPPVDTAGSVCSSRGSVGRPARQTGDTQPVRRAQACIRGHATSVNHGSSASAWSARTRCSPTSCRLAPA